MKDIVLTGGGTAGHVTPNLALVDGLRAQGCAIHYIGSKGGMEQALVEAAGLPYYGISAGKLRRYFSLKNVSDSFRVLAGYFQARKTLKKLRPSLVFSKGGFVTVPVVIAAHALKIPIILHESDCTPGLANRICMRYANKVLVTFEDTLQHVQGKDCALTGTPLRQELLRGDHEEGLHQLGFNGDKPVLLCMGGSQGASAINAALRGALDQLLPTFDIVHLCGAGKLEAALEGKAGYRQLEYARESLPDIFACASLAISRAGANSAFELMALRLPSLLIPLTLEQSRGDQIRNARCLQAQGCAMTMDQSGLTPDSLVSAVLDLHAHREGYIQAMENMQADGTQAVLREIGKFMEGR